MYFACMRSQAAELDPRFFFPPQSINWDDTQPAEGPNMYMKVLMKETLTLHKVLSKYLATQAVEVSVLSTVF